jgi:hypothetical protein
LRNKHYRKPKAITGLYDKYCSMDIESGEKLIEENRLENCEYPNFSDLLQHTYCEIKKN